jgi:hypothetical protein
MVRPILTLWSHVAGSEYSSINGLDHQITDECDTILTCKKTIYFSV